jgi:hypothetical protein
MAGKKSGFPGADKIMNFISDNKDIISNVVDLVSSPKQQDFNVSPQAQIPDFSPTTMAAPEIQIQPQQSAVSMLSSQENIESTVSSLSTFVRLKNVFIFLIILWAITTIIARFYLEDEEKKKDIEFVNTTLFGNIGVIPTISSIWLVSVLIISLVPALLQALPKLTDVSGKIGGAFTDIIKKIPELVMKAV